MLSPSFVLLCPLLLRGTRRISTFYRTSGKQSLRATLVALATLALLVDAFAVSAPFALPARTVRYSA